MAQVSSSDTDLAQEIRELALELRRTGDSLSLARAELIRVKHAQAELLHKTSHELRTPLNVIIGFSELMLDEVAGQINEDQRQNLSDILEGGKRMMKLVDDMLDASKMEPENRQ